MTGVLISALPQAQAGLITGINAASAMLAASDAVAGSYAVTQKEQQIVQGLGYLGELGFTDEGVKAFSGSGVHPSVARWVEEHDLNKDPLPPKPQMDGAKDHVRFGGLDVNYQRTLRIPDDGRTHGLPAGFGPFPLRKVSDLGERAPASWREEGGVVMPMYQREAMWINFRSAADAAGLGSKLPYAVKVAAGLINAVSGAKWHDGLNRTKNDYVVAPRPQYWLDGFNAGKDAQGVDVIRQFVAMPLGMGYTVEGQLTGEEVHGGLQLLVYALKPEVLVRTWAPQITQLVGALHMALKDYQNPPSLRFMGVTFRGATLGGATKGARGAGEMGLAQGGLMKQQIFDDKEHGYDDWDQERFGKFWVHIVDSLSWKELTGEEPPSTPITKAMYEARGVPWFDMYDEDAKTANRPTKLDGAKSLAQMDTQHGFKTDAAEPVDASKGPTVVIPTADGKVPGGAGSKPKKLPGAVDEGTW